MFLAQPAMDGQACLPSLTVLLHRLRIGLGDVLTFYDGDDLTARVLGQYSGPRGHFKLFTSMADVTIQFQSDPGASMMGYQQGFVIHFFGKLTSAHLIAVGVGRTGRALRLPSTDSKPEQVRVAWLWEGARMFLLEGKPGLTKRQLI